MAIHDESFPCRPVEEAHGGTADPARLPGGARRRRLALPLVALAGLLVGGGTVAAAPEAGMWGSASPFRPVSREFMFQVLGVQTANQGGRTMNLFFRYRYRSGIAEKDIPNYLDLRRDALAYLATTDLSRNPYWETLNSRLCGELTDRYPLSAISCEMQVVGSELPGDPEPGYRASVETIGEIEPLRIPGPVTGR